MKEKRGEKKRKKIGVDFWSNILPMFGIGKY